MISSVCRLNVAILLIPLLAACGEDSSARTSAPIVRDSAGITIVENIAPRWEPGGGWSLSADPVVIGSLDGPAEYQLFRVTDATRLSDGRILLANGGTGELRYYDESGDYLGSVGGPGSGPGEYRGIGAIEQHGDSLYVIDQTLGRVSVVAADGTFARSFPIPLPRYFRSPSGSFTDGTLLFGGLDVGLEQGALVEGRRRDPMRYFRVSTTGEVIDTLGPFQGPERVSHTRSIGGQRAITLQFATFNPTFTIRAHDDELVAALGRKYEISYLRPDGSVERIVRRPFTLEAVTDADIQRNAAIQRTLAEERGQEFDEAVLEAPRAEFFSAYGPVVVDAVGNTWVSEYRRPWHEGPLAWSIFDPEGTWLGEVELPDRLGVFEIGADYLIGSLRDDFDVEFLHIYRLEK